MGMNNIMYSWISRFKKTVANWFCRRTTGSPANKPASSASGSGTGGTSGTSVGANNLTTSGVATGSSGSGATVSGIGTVNAGTSGISIGTNVGTGNVASGTVESRTPTIGVQNKQLQNVKGEHPSVYIFHIFFFFLQK